jgi:hypothetical protein
MHVSLDSALGRQRRLNSVGESVLQIAPNAAAAYSLRSLTGGDPKVVRVRRASDNGERDFTSSEITSGEMVSWVNRQVIKPLDIQALEADGRTGDFLIAKAAYSLRSLGTRQATLAATGDTVARANGKFVVQVRRSSDDALKSFTATEITDGTLLSFVTDAQVGWNVQPTFSNDSGTGSVTSQSSTATTATVAFTGDADLIRQTSKPNHVLGSSGDQVIFNISASGLDSSGTLRLRTSGTNTTVGSSSISNGNNQDITLNLTGSAGYLAMTFAASSGGTITFNSIKVLPKTGFVKTWYDQSVTNEAGDTATGNHAVQATAANQPLIVSAGALVADNGIAFDGSTSKRTLVAPSVSGLETKLSVFSTSIRAGSGHPVSLSFSSNSSKYFAIQEGGLYSRLNTRNTTNVFADSATSGTDRLTFGLTTGDTITSAGSLGSALTTTTTDYGNDFDSNDLNQILIGTLRTVSPSNGHYYSGRIREIIIYAGATHGDQTANRAAIEANIGEAYSIDLPSGVDPGFDQVDGFVETWYDQSGNSNDVTQATAGSQPKIVNAGSLVTVGSRASFKFDGSSDFLERETYTQGSLSQPNTLFSVAELDAYVDGNQKVYDGHVSTSRNMLQLNTAGNGQFAHFAGLVAATGEDADADRHLFTSLINGASSDLRIDGTSKTTANTASQAMTGIVIGANHNTLENFWDGDIQEIIIYNSNQSSTTTAVETNINSHYSIF